MALPPVFFFHYSRLFLTSMLLSTLLFFLFSTLFVGGRGPRGSVTKVLWLWPFPQFSFFIIPDYLFLSSMLLSTLLFFLFSTLFLKYENWKFPAIRYMPRLGRNTLFLVTQLAYIVACREQIIYDDTPKGVIFPGPNMHFSGRQSKF